MSSLPPEILVKIFELVVEDVESGPATSISDAVTRLQVNPNPSVVNAISLSHVNQQWRSISLATPCLWTRIELWDGLDRVHAFLERSKSMLIDISLNSAVEESQFSTIIDESIDARLQRKGIPDAVTVAVTHADRWRSFSWIQTYLFQEEDRVLPCLVDIQTPNLQVITVSDPRHILFSPLSIREAVITEQLPTDPNNSLLELFSRLTSLTCCMPRGRSTKPSGLPNF